MSVYNVGTVTVTNGSNVVTGYGTSFSANVSVGDRFIRLGDAVWYTVSSVDSNTQLHLSSNYGGASGSGLYYEIYRDFTPNAKLPKLYGGDRADWPVVIADLADKIDNWALGWNETPFTCTYASATSFTCSGDKTSLFTTGTRLKIVHAGGTTYHNVTGSSYSAPNTTVNIDGSISTPISQVQHSLMIMGANGPLQNPVFATIKLTSLTDGYVPYHVSDAAGLANSGLYWDSVNLRLGIGTTTPNAPLSLIGGSDIRFLVYDGRKIAEGGNGVFVGFSIDMPTNSFNMLAHSLGFLLFGRFTNMNDLNNITEFMRITNAGNVGINQGNPIISGTGKLHMTADTFRLDTARTPASAGAAGNAGEYCWDANYLYICIAANAWQRVAHSSW